MILGERLVRVASLKQSTGSESYPSDVEVSDNGDVIIALSSEDDGATISYGIVEAGVVALWHVYVVAVVEDVDAVDHLVDGSPCVWRQGPVSAQQPGSHCIK